MRRTPSAKVASAGVTHTRLAIEDELGWLFREQSTEDYGIDAYAEVVDGEDVRGRLLALQVKSGTSWFDEQGPEGWWFRPAAEHVQYWLSYSLPVVVVLYHPATKRCHWQLVNRETLVETSTGGLKLLVPEVQTLDENARVPLREAAEGDSYVSPVQIAAADALLYAEPFGSTRLREEIDPVAAAVAAAHWMQAAVDVTAEVADCERIGVVLEADNIEALEVETLIFVLERLNDGRSPREVVTDLVERAATDEDDFRFTLPPARSTRPDARRPAHDLLEDLLSGIQGCWLVYIDFADFAEFGLDDLDDDDLDEDEAERRREEVFFEEVRSEARNSKKRLL